MLCPPVGYDYFQAHYAIRQTAERLMRAGHCVLRFDYDGTGDSVGNDSDPERVEAWLDSIGEAVACVRRTGVGHVTIVGMRLGATLAAEAAARDGAIDALVLWDPCASGGTFLKEQRMLGLVSFGIKPDRDDGAIEVPGFVHNSATVSSLRELSISSISRRLATRVLVLLRSRYAHERSMISRLERDAVEWGEASGQEELIDAWAPSLVLPHAAIDRIVEWISLEAGTDASPVTPPPLRPAAAVAMGQCDLPVLERPVRLGPTGLFGIVSEIPEVATGPTVIMLSVATQPHIGPSRLWVELSRWWASAGMRVLRVDMSGVGDSPTRAAQRELVTFAPEAFDDVAEVAEAVSPGDPSDVVLVGLCASAYQALESALLLGPRGVVAVNPILSFSPPEFSASVPLTTRRRIALPQTAAIRVFQGEAPLSALRRRFPDIGWRVRLTMDRKYRPVNWLMELSTSRVNTLLVCGEREARPFQQGMTRRAAAKLRDSGIYRFEFIPGLSHSLLVAADRENVTTMVSEHVLQCFGSVRHPTGVGTDVL
ncbi:MAG: alpha/beta hydrolase family protein [Acidimicrobiales bacterium]